MQGRNRRWYQTKPISPSCHVMAFKRAGQSYPYGWLLHRGHSLRAFPATTSVCPASNTAFPSLGSAMIFYVEPALLEPTMYAFHIRCSLFDDTPSRSARHSLHLLRCASAMRALPSAVLGPVDLPPWYLQRCIPGTTLFLQIAPMRVVASQSGLSRAGRAAPSSAKPRACIFSQALPWHREQEIGRAHV